MNDTIEMFDALDLHATVESGGVSIHMDGDRDAELMVEGPEPGGEIFDGKVYRLTLTGNQNGVHSDVGFFVPVETIEELQTESDQ